MNLKAVFPDNIFTQENDIDIIFRSYWIILKGYYVINNDQSIDVYGNIEFPSISGYLTELPLKFNKVSGDFNCSGLSLNTLKGAPAEVGGIFNCSYNNLTTLEFSPIKASTFIFDNTVACLSTGNSNYFDDVSVIFRNSESKIPTIIDDHQEMLATIFKYQDFYQVWDDKGSLNIAGIHELIQEINEGLE